MIISHNPFWPKNAFRFGGGGGNQAQQIESAPVPTPAPPVTANSAEVLQAEQDVAQQNLLKKSVKKTILAGDTGGWKTGASPATGSPPSYKPKLG